MTGLQNETIGEAAFWERFRKTTKYCPRCQTEKPVADFAKGAPTMLDGLHSYCRPCCRLYFASWAYGVTVEEAAVLYARKSCDICDRPFTDAPKQRQIDHDHKTGKVRGVLCRYCNGVLSHFDDEEKLRRILNYLNL